MNETRCVLLALFVALVAAGFAAYAWQAGYRAALFKWERKRAEVRCDGPQRITITLDNPPTSQQMDALSAIVRDLVAREPRMARAGLMGEVRR